MPDHGVADFAAGSTHEFWIGRVLLEQSGEVAAVEVFVLRSLRAGQGKDGWVEVEAVDHHVGFDTRRNARAGDD